MFLTKISLKRPMAALIVTMSIIAFGLFAYIQMPVDLLPSMNFPTITVITIYPGATPEQVDSMVSKHIEEAVSNINGIKYVEATSQNSASVVICEFDYEVDLKETRQKMEDQIDSIVSKLPADAEKPMVSGVDVAGSPLITLSISGESSQEDVSQFAEKYVKNSIEKITGIAKVEIEGNIENEVTIFLNPNQMDTAGISSTDVTYGLQFMNNSIPLGETIHNDKNISIVSDNIIDTVELLETVPIKSLMGNSTALLSEFSRIEVTEKRDSSASTYNSNPNVNLYVYKKTGGNSLKLATLIENEVSRLNTNDLNMKIEVTDNQASFISTSLGNVWQSLIIGGILAIIVLCLFLKSFKTAMVIGISIPVSIIATIGLMYLVNTPLNIISLGGLAIGVGMVVDNAIVVLESIYKVREEGGNIMNSALEGTRIIVGAVFASTLTTIAVFLPVGLTTGFTKEIFAQLSTTITFSLIASFLVAITVVPMLSTKLISTGDKKNILDKFFIGLENGYEKVLSFTVKRKFLVTISAFLLFAISIGLVPMIGTEFLPPMDQGIVKISLTLESGLRLDDIQNEVYKLEDKLYQIPEIKTIQAAMGTRQDGSTGADLSCKLIPASERIDVNAVAQNVRNSLDTAYPDMDIKVTPVNDLMNAMFGDLGSFGSPISVGVSANSLDELNQISDEVKKVITEIDGTANISSTQDIKINDIKVKVDNRKAAALGLNPLSVSSFVRTAIEGSSPISVTVDGKTMDVVVRFEERYVDSLTKIKQLQLKTYTNMLATQDNNNDVALSSIASFSNTDSQSVIRKKDGMYYGEITGITIGRPSGAVNKDISTALSNYSFPMNTEISYGGQQSLFAESFAGLMNALAFSIVIVYVVMAIQFNSLLNPFVIMMSLPFAFSGSLIILLLMGLTLNVVSFIGLIMLVGIVVNNAIVLIDRITYLREHGQSLHDAIVHAGSSRMRPILMTAMTTILGLLPLLLISGDGTELMKPMAAVVVGGMVTSTLLSLAVIPALYAIFNKERKKGDTTL